MPDDDVKKEKEDLLAILTKVPERCDQLDSVGRDLLRDSSEARATAKFGSVLFRVMPTDAPGAAEAVRMARKRWEEFNTSANDLLTAVYGVAPITAVVSGTSASAAISSTLPIQFATLRPEDHDAFMRAEAEYRQHVELGELLASVKQEMVRLKLDTQVGGNKAPTTLLSEAHSVLLYAFVAGGVSAVLLALRIPIDRTIEELIRRRPRPEPAGNRREKILSIGRMCAKRGLAPDHFESLADDDKNLNDELSGFGKGKVADLAALRSAFYRGALFLRALLTAVDESLLRPP